jgi:hypothetical protein
MQKDIAGGTPAGPLCSGGVLVETKNTVLKKGKKVASGGEG